MAAVITYHSGLPVPGGFVGVDMFFVISGYVITTMLLREWQFRKRIAFRQFYIRRIRRLAPALAVMTSITVFASFFILSPFGPQQVAGQTGLGAILNVGNLVIARSTGNYFDPAADANPLLHTWSLSVEEQFYWIFPIVLVVGLLIGSRFSRGLIRAVVPIFFVGLLSFGMLAIASSSFFYQLFPWLSAFYNPLMRFWEFAAGVCLALIFPHISRLSRGLAWISGAFGILLIIGSFWIINDSMPFPGRWTLLPVIGTSLLILSGINQRNPFSKILSSMPIVNVGNYSYSLYLWHWPFIVFASLLSNGNRAIILAATVVSFAPAVASYRCLENPIRRLDHLDKRQLGILLWSFIGAPVVGLSVYLVVLNSNFLDSWQKSINPAAAIRHPYNSQGCDGLISADTGLPATCNWNRDASGPPIYLLGDSNAGQFDEAVIFAGAALGRPIWISGSAGCPFLGFESQTASSSCAESNEALLGWLENSPPGTVVISNAAVNMYRYVGLESQNEIYFPKEGRQFQSELTNNLSVLVAQIQEFGNTVILVNPLPSFNFEDTYWPVEGCGILSLALSDCRIQVSREFIDRQQEVVEDVLLAVSEQTHASVLDLNSEYCNEDFCSNSWDGDLRYQDRSHISTQEASRLGPQFFKHIQGIP